MGRIKLSYLLFFSSLFLILLFFHTHGLIIHDEGYILNSAQRIFTGQTIYKDFHFAYTPLSPYFISLAFILFGDSVLASRIMMILLSFVSSILVFSIIKRVTKRDIYAYLATSLYVAWGPSHINFAWPVMFVLPPTFFICYLILIYIDTRKKLIPFVVGLSSFVVFLFKQNFGIVLIPVITSFLLIRPIKKTHFINIIYGFIWGVILFTIYLLLTNSLLAFLMDFYNYTIEKVLTQNGLTTPFIYYDSSLLRMAGRTLIYLSPALFSLLTIVLLIYRKRYFLLFLPLMVLLFYVIGIRPTTDYVHIVPLLSLVGIPIVISINQLPLSWVKLIGYTMLLVLIFFGFETALYKGYYRWDIPLIRNTAFLDAPKANVFTNQIFKQDFISLKTIVDKRTTKNDYVFINTYTPLLYFLLDRRQPTGYDYPNFTDTATYQKSVIYSLIIKKVPIVILLNNMETTPLDKYIHSNYQLLGKVGQYFIYEKNLTMRIRTSSINP
jgi:hypothetical protein